MQTKAFSTIFSLLLFADRLSAQLVPVHREDSLQSRFFDISKINLSESIQKNIGFSYLDNNVSLTEKYSSLIFNTGAIHPRQIPDKYVTQKAILRFNVCNGSDSIRSVWFFLGLYYWDSQLHKLEENTLKKIPSILPDQPKEISYRYITLPAHDSAIIIAELSFVRTHLNSIRPMLISPGYLASYVKDLDSTNMESKIVTYLFCGLLLMMILFSLASFFQGANPEFLYYSGYAFFLGLMLFIKAIYSYHTTWFGFFQ